MAKRFLNNININDQYTFPSTDGSAGQAIITDGAGNLTFGSATAASADSAESIHISVKNTSGAQILKGTPVYVTGETGNSGKIEVAPADASDSAKMPALGLLESTLDNNAEGFCVQGGLLEGLATATIDGTATTANDTVYVKPGGGLTMTKPTGTGLIQNIAKVARAHASNGTLVVSSILRTNDVPNLTTGKIWVGDGNTVESTVVHLDEVNGRMGIGTASPQAPLHVLDDNGIIIGDSEYNNGIQLKHYGGGLTLRRVEEFGSSDIFRVDINGNVGIGTTSPSEKLQIYEGGNTAYKSYTNTNAGAILTSYQSTFSPFTKTTDLVAGSDGTVPSEIRFLTRESGVSTVDERMRITSAGNVGIGTASPYQKLTVNGVIEAGDDPATNGALTLVQKYNENNYIGSISTQYSSGAMILGYGARGKAGSGSTSFTSTFDNFNGIRGALRLKNGELSLYSTLLATQEAVGNDLSMTNTFIVTSGGNVGIGTTSPAYKLDVSAAARVNGVRIGRDFSIADRGTVRIDSNGTGSPADVLFGHTAAANEISWSGVYWSLSSRGTQDSGKFQLWRGSAHAAPYNSELKVLTALPNGNIGIGTADPSTTLDVNGSTQIKDYIRITNAGGAQRILLGNQDSAGVDNPSVILAANGNTYIGGGDSWSGNGGTLDYTATFTDAGNVGIGTTIPSRALHVVGGDGGTGTHIAQFEGRSGVVGMYVRGDGNVGIGTTSPSYKLDVGDGSTTIQAIRIHAGVNGSASLRLKNDAQDWDVNTQTNDTFAIYNQTSGTQPFSILPNGNVGINNTNPEAKLDVRPANGNGKVLRVGNYSVSTYFYNTQADATINLTCGSYYQAEVIITANQTNGGDYNNIYIRGIWSNNHTTHHWDEIESIGFLGGSSIGITVGEDTVSNSGKLSIDFNYTSQSFSALNIKVTDFFGSHSYSIS